MTARDDKSRFRITPWPSEPVPIPGPQFTLAAGLVDESGEGVIPLNEVWEWGTDNYGEVYLELVALDLDDEQQIADFVRKHQVLSVWSPDWATEFDECDFFGFPEEYGWFVYAEYLEDRRGQVLAKLDSRVGPVETVEEFRWGAYALRDMLTAWRLAKGEITEKEAVWEAPCWSDSIHRFKFNEPELIGPAHPPSVLARGMKAALRPFSPRVTWIFDEELPIKPHGRTSEMLPLYSILALELFNHIVERADYRRCANERCGHFFVRQRGRSVHGQHRTRGVKYCSIECARAQAQRAYRRRKREAAT